VLHEIVKAPLLTDEAVIAGAAGTAAGVTDAEGLEGADVASVLVAVTVNEYEMPFVKPVTLQDVVADSQEYTPVESVAT